MTPEEHLALAADLLAGSFKRDNAPFTPYRYALTPPTRDAVALATAHATVASAKLAFERAGRVTVAAPEIRPAAPAGENHRQPVSSTRS